MIFKAALLVVLPIFAAAQYGGYGGGGGGGDVGDDNGGGGGHGADDSTSGTSTATGAVAVPSAPANTAGHINIDVAFNGNFAFNPASVTAPQGTLVTFWFPDSQVEHSVTQSSFAAPCTYLAASGSTPAGFDSGLTKAAQFTINITDATKPIWFHCKQAGHCGLGMVGSINAPTTGNTQDNFVAAAKAIGGNAPTEKDNGAVTGGVNAIATAPPSNTAGGSGGSSTPTGSGSGSGSGATQTNSASTSTNTVAGGSNVDKGSGATQTVAGAGFAAIVAAVVALAV